MRLFKILTVFILAEFHAIAQSPSPVGIYYLEGVMETASGIKLDADSTFEFFFSQGALDRTGKGKWSKEGDDLILQSEGLPAPGFTLMKSEKRKDGKNTVVVNETNTMLLSFIYVQLTGAGIPEFLKLGTDGKMEFGKGDVKKIELLFEICPERIHEFAPKRSGDNYFEFAIHPEILEVYTKNLKLKFTDGGLEGAHPLLKGEDFYYRKE